MKTSVRVLLKKDWFDKGMQISSHLTVRQKSEKGKDGLIHPPTTMKHKKETLALLPLHVLVQYTAFLSLILLYKALEVILILLLGAEKINGLS